LPFSIGDVSGQVAPFHGRQLQVNLVSVVGPRSELHLAALIIEGEPSDVDLAGALEDARRDVRATAVVSNHHIRVVRSIELLVCTATNTYLVYTKTAKLIFHLPEISLGITNTACSSYPKIGKSQSFDVFRRVDSSFDDKSDVHTRKK
ncbi:UNVERIFIED_CONTAM: hypothetical protein NCL1_49246, partial [Trichonephila clavipes]